MRYIDQSFSPVALKEIWDRETRKGFNLPKQFAERSTIVDPVLAVIAANIDSSRRERMSVRLLRRSGASESAVLRAKESLKALLNDRDALVQELMHASSARITRSAFRLEFRRLANVDGKEIYTISGNFSDQLLAMKQVQRILKSTFHLRMANRRLIVRQVIAHLGDKFPKTILRIDVASFYENIDHAILIKELEKNSSLGRSTLKLIKTFLSDFADLSSLPRGKGLPRGLGLSAYLAELYMLPFDREVIESAETIFYARFVDDIIAVFSEQVSSNGARVSKKAHLADRLSALRLTISTAPEKNFNKNVSKGQPDFANLNYLGYEISKVNNEIQVRLSDARSARLSKKLSSAFAAYDRTSFKSGSAYKMLLRRIQYLTTNSRLLNNKRQAFVGIYFSNEHVNTFDQLEQLDLELIAFRSKVLDPHLADALGEWNFVAGFQNRTLSRWTGDQLRSIPLIWSF